VRDVPIEATDSSGRISALKRPGRVRWQVGLRTAFLLVAALAVWMAYFVNRRHNAFVESRIRALAPLAHELVIDDPSKIAVVKMEEYWYGENRWEFYLPVGDYRLRLATRGIDGTGFPEPAQDVRIETGRHVVSLDETKLDNGWRIKVVCDGKDLVAVDESKEWDAGHGSQSTGQGVPSQQLPPEKRVVLLRRQFMGEYTPNGPVVTKEGILVWIERMAATGGKR
jgi:hypothetical protein